jgi:hypothetical protein
LSSHKGFKEEVKKHWKKYLPNKISKIFELDYSIRGSYLVQAITIESLITDIISQYFCQNNKRRGLFFGSVMNRITFSDKIRILNQILEHHYPQSYKKYDKLKKQLETVNKLRNLLAHSLSSYSPEFVNKFDDRIVMSFYKDGKLVKRTITIQDVAKNTRDFESIVDKLYEILTVFKVDTRPVIE